MVARITKPAGWVVLNGDDPRVSAMAALTEAAVSIRTRIDEQVEGSAEIAQVVTALERQYDAFVTAQENRALLSDEDLPSGDELGAEFERFLAQQTDEKGDLRDDNGGG
mgnify:CR=1 FL=1